MASIECPYNKDHGMIFTTRLDEHRIKEHPEQVEGHILMCISNTEKQVEYIYNKHPETRLDNGLMLFYLAKAYPKISLTERGGIWELRGMYDDFFYFLKHTNSATRLGRHIRQGITRLKPKEIEGKRFKTMDAVKSIFEKNNAARFNEGVLAVEFMRFFAPEGISMSYENSVLTLNAGKERLMDALRLVEGISRASRKLREIHPYEESIVAEKRDVEYSYSRVYWAGYKNAESI